MGPGDRRGRRYAQESRTCECLCPRRIRQFLSRSTTHMDMLNSVGGCRRSIRGFSGTSRTAYKQWKQGGVWTGPRQRCVTVSLSKGPGALERKLI